MAQLNVRMEDELKRKFLAKCMFEGKSAQDIVVELVAQWINAPSISVEKEQPQVLPAPEPKSSSGGLGWVDESSPSRVESSPEVTRDQTDGKIRINTKYAPVPGWEPDEPEVESFLRGGGKSSQSTAKSSSDPDFLEELFKNK